MKPSLVRVTLSFHSQFSSYHIEKIVGAATIPFSDPKTRKSVVLRVSDSLTEEQANELANTRTLEVSVITAKA